jgi:hypothetical protein
MKDFVIEPFRFQLLEKKPDSFLFKLVSDHQFLCIKKSRKDDIIGLIDGNAVILNQIIKHTRNNYVYFVSSIFVKENEIFLSMLRKKFEPKNIEESLKRQRIALDSLENKNLSPPMETPRLRSPRVRSILGSIDALPTYVPAPIREEVQWDSSTGFDGDQNRLIANTVIAMDNCPTSDRIPSYLETIIDHISCFMDNEPRGSLRYQALLLSRTAFENRLSALRDEDDNSPPEMEFEQEFQSEPADNVACPYTAVFGGQGTSIDPQSVIPNTVANTINPIGSYVINQPINWGNLVNAVNP